MYAAGLSARHINRYLTDLLQRHGLHVGTTLENRVTWRLHQWGALDRVQHPVDRYRIDYAWPDVLIALEVDGWMHRQPEQAARDAVRDSRLRSLGWLVFRVNDADGIDLDKQLSRVVEVINLVVDQSYSPTATPAVTSDRP